MAVANVDLFGQVFTNSGNPGNGYKVYTYEGGTETPLATYTSSTGGVANANPIVADSAGRFECWATTGVAYKFVLATDADVILDTVDNFVVGSGVAASGNTFADLVWFFADGPPTATDVIYSESFTRAVSFQANFSGSYGKVVGTNPASSFVITVKKSGSTVGTITISTAGAYTFATSGGATVSFIAGDYITFYAPGVADTQIADFGATLAGAVG